MVPYNDKIPRITDLPMSPGMYYFILWMITLKMNINTEKSKLAAKCRNLNFVKIKNVILYLLYDIVYLFDNLTKPSRVHITGLNNILIFC